jgi:hypothetical protein
MDFFNAEAVVVRDFEAERAEREAALRRIHGPHIPQAAYDAAMAQDPRISRHARQTILVR